MVGCMAKKKTSEAMDEVEVETAEEAKVEEEGAQMQVDPENQKIECGCLNPTIFINAVNWQWQ